MITTTTKIYISRRGMKELKKDISSIERRLDGYRRDLRELDKTAGYEERLILTEKLALLEAAETELAEKKMTMQTAVLLPRKRDALKVAIGSVVDLLDTKGRLVQYTLVDSIEANPSDGRISIKSPLGQNLVGKQIREMVQWSTGRGSHELTLVRIG